MTWLIMKAAVTAFLQSPFGRWIAAGLACLALLTGTYAIGHHNGAQAEKAAEAKRLVVAKAKVAKREEAAKAISSDIATKTEAARVEIRWRTKTLIQKVPDYVPPIADSACVVPSGFVQLYDAAAAGLPAPAGGPDPAPSGVPLSRVLETDIDNLGVGYDYRAEVIAWRTWYAAQAKAWNK